ncbi:hypothetical protein [Leptospira phage LE3]|uniref:Uncharacterized protein n=2 Tax=Nylescharonvirus TaxID=2843431 RepID=A0A343LED7_9CAUD|nr:hypothetical protein HWB33_gp36 [Leptospira phage LE3]YP_009835509.1 hypothetical protein HWB34_gp34 [Leptospira phage LE4]ATN94958.1 hypothetical protein [Leptospira phage LE3]ATN95047.1 hypothetical protein [Leptospira phage LE4]
MDHIYRCLQFIDFSEEIFRAESLAIITETSGGISRKELLNFTFDDYDYTVEEIAELQKQRKEDESKWNESE